MGNASTRRISVVVLGSLSAKSLVKISVGVSCHYIPLVLEGIRGVFDIVRHVVVRSVGYHARAKPDENFPIGKRALFPVVSLSLGVCSLILAWNILSELAGVLLTVMHPTLLHFSGTGLLREIVDFLGRIVTEEKMPTTSGLFLCASAMIGSGALTRWVNGVELGYGRRHHLHELEAEAEDNHLSVILEYTIGACLAITAGATAMGFEDSGMIYQISTVVALGFVLWVVVRHSLEVLRHSAHALISPALRKEEVRQLEKAINRELPIGVTIDRSCPIVAFKQSSAAFVSLQLSVPSSLLGMSHSLARRAKALAESYLRHIYNPVRVDVLCVQIDEAQELDLQIARALRLEWELDPDCAFAQIVCAARRGDFAEAESLLRDRLPISPIEQRAAAWTRLWINLYSKGPNHPDTAAAIAPPAEWQEGAPPACPTVLCQGLSLIAVSQRSASEERTALARKYVAFLSSAAGSAAVADFGRAEASFALGIYEQYVTANSQEAFRRFREAECHFVHGGYGLEVDRLYTSWGHLLTLHFRLGPARVLLEAACVLKERRHDQVGLTFAYGCMADSHSRNTKYEEADSFYQRDLELCGKLGLKHFLPGVRLKQALNLYRFGAARQDASLVAAGRALAGEVLGGECPPVSAWFAHKEIVKCLLMETVLTSDPKQKPRLRQEANEAITGWVKVRAGMKENEYFAGLAMLIEGRGLARNEDWVGAGSRIEESAAALKRIFASSGESSLVPLILQVEAATCRLFADNDLRSLVARLAVVQQYLEEEKGYLDELGLALTEHCVQLQERLRHFNSSSRKDELLVHVAVFVATVEP